MAQAKIKNMVCGVLVTAAVSAYTYQGACEQMDIQEPSRQMCKYDPLDDYPDDTYYRIVSEETVILKRINDLQNFVSSLVEKSEDLDPIFSASVDKHFWDLV